jgi:hypothetical protein
VVSYASIVLWNWKLLNPTKPWDLEHIIG